ncbi:MAG: hypothetical protein ABI603_16130 [Acidobacteriota bacterium]
MGHRPGLVAFSIAAALIAGCERHPTPAAEQAAPPSAAPAPAEGARRSDVPVLADFDARVKDYVALHRRLEDTLPHLSNNSTPQQIDSHQRALARLLQEARADATPGAIFTSDIQAVVQRLMAQVFGGPDGAALKASIMDENPGPLKLTVNSRYPDTIPLSTVPPQVLQGLPTLPEELEFRFIGRHLILMDERAHLVVDLMENVLPR